ncbi:MAG: ABC transporter ATP-binding protein, partial [Nanoarchaeota archaeon]|nr:ABC transporter ATP-binding protein [Nanoarchaeota archaeon]
VGFAAQTPSFYPTLTVSENLDYFSALYNMPRKARLSNISLLLELVELSGARNILAKNLSGGMQRRLDIACAIIHNPSILILDEPTSDLDPVLSKHIWFLLQKINRRGTTVIVASHHLSDMESVCSRIGILNSGKLTNIGTLHELTSGRGHQIVVETYPGNYDRITKKLSDPSILSIENRGSELVVTAKKPEQVLHKILHLTGEMDETLIDVSITKLGLGDLFSFVNKKNK